jgi:hypothetical protein
MRKPYSKRELRTLKMLEQKYGNISYYKASEIESEFFAETGVYRASGALYMALWRLNNGYYNHLLESA